MANPKTPSAYKEDFQAVERIEAPDPYTVNIVYRTSYAKSLQSWAMPILPRHLLEPWVQEGKLKESPEYRSRPVGTGPYRFKEWKPGEKVVLVANPDYFAGRPYLGRVVYRVIPSQATQFLELKAKGIDAMSLTALQYTRQTDYPAFRKAYDKFKYAVQRLHVLRPQPQGRAVRRSARPPRLRPRHQQARADRPRHSRSGGGRHRALQAGHLGLQPQGAHLSVRPRSGRRPSWPRRAGGSATPTASS